MIRNWEQTPRRDKVLLGLVSVAIVLYVMFFFVQAHKWHYRNASPFARAWMARPRKVSCERFMLSNIGAQGGTPYLLPSMDVQVTFVLPKGSPPGNYEVLIGHSPDGPKPSAWAHGLSKANGTELQIPVELDLSNVEAGDYYLWTVLNNDEPTVYYPLEVRPPIDTPDPNCGP